MRKGIKKAISFALAVLTSATLAVTAFAANYVSNPGWASNPSQSVAASTGTIKSAVDGVTDGGVATVDVKSTTSLPVGSNVIKALKKSGATLEISAPHITYTIDSNSIDKVRKVDLSSKVYCSNSKEVVDFKSKADFGCEVTVVVKHHKTSVKKLAKAHIYCDGEDLGAAEVDKDGNVTFTVTKGGKYEIK